MSKPQKTLKDIEEALDKLVASRKKADNVEELKSEPVLQQIHEGSQDHHIDEPRVR
jgi:hypothetical protein